MKFNGDVSILRELAFIVVAIMPGQLEGCFCNHGSAWDPAADFQKSTHAPIHNIVAFSWPCSITWL